MVSYGMTFLPCIKEVTQLVREITLTYTTPSSSTINLRNVYFTLRIAPASFTYRERAFTTQYTQNSTKLAYKNGNWGCAVDACNTAQRLQQLGQLRCSHDYVRRCSKCVTLPLSAARLQIIKSALWLYQYAGPKACFAFTHIYRYPTLTTYTTHRTMVPHVH